MSANSQTTTRTPSIFQRKMECKRREIKYANNKRGRVKVERHPLHAGAGIMIMQSRSFPMQFDEDLQECKKHPDHHNKRNREESHRERERDV